MPTLSPEAASLSSSFRACGVRPGGPLLVHSSLSALGAVDGGADTVLDALLDVLGGGTLVIPTLSYLFTTPTSPTFDARSTPSNLGALPAAALRRAWAAGGGGGNGGGDGGDGNGSSGDGSGAPTAVRSLHPTHSCVALGPHAAELVAGHGEDDSPVGPHSPFVRVCRQGGQVLFLGCGARCNTTIHGVEEALPSGPPPYLLRPDRIVYTITDARGATHTVAHRRHDFADVGQRYERLVELMPPGTATISAVRGAATILLDADAMWRAATAALERDAGALVERGVKEGHVLVAGKSEGVWRYAVTSERVVEETGGGEAS